MDQSLCHGRLSQLTSTIGIYMCDRYMYLKCHIEWLVWYRQEEVSSEFLINTCSLEKSISLVRCGVGIVLFFIFFISFKS